jgi:glutathione S-transferase
MFSAGDLMTIDVVRRLDGSGLQDDAPNLSAFVG